MTPETQLFFTLFGSITVAVMGFMLKAAWDEIGNLRVQIGNMREEIPKNYITKSEVVTGLKDINTRLDQLFLILQNKADKEHAKQF